VNRGDYILIIQLFLINGETYILNRTSCHKLTWYITSSSPMTLANIVRERDRGVKMRSRLKSEKEMKTIVYYIIKSTNSINWPTKWNWLWSGTTCLKFSYFGEKKCEQSDLWPFPALQRKVLLAFWLRKMFQSFEHFQPKIGE
jgi:hypothetical protein